jgi:hypothetical protein
MVLSEIRAVSRLIYNGMWDATPLDDGKGWNLKGTGARIRTDKARWSPGQVWISVCGALSIRRSLALPASVAFRCMTEPRIHYGIGPTLRLLLKWFKTKNGLNKRRPTLAVLLGTSHVSEV